MKTCDYCGKVGEMPTFIGGDTCCGSCLLTFAPGNTETRRREHQLKMRIAKIEGVIEQIMVNNLAFKPSCSHCMETIKLIHGVVK